MLSNDNYLNKPDFLSYYYRDSYLQEFNYFSSKNVKFGAEYKQDFLFTRTSLDLFKGPTLSGDAVIGFV